MRTEIYKNGTLMRVMWLDRDFLEFVAIHSNDFYIQQIDDNRVINAMTGTHKGDGVQGIEVESAVSDDIEIDYNTALKVKGYNEEVTHLYNQGYHGHMDKMRINEQLNLLVRDCLKFKRDNGRLAGYGEVNAHGMFLKPYKFYNALINMRLMLEVA